MLLATWLRGIPNVIFEPNAEPGFTNKVLARICRRASPPATKYLPADLGSQERSSPAARCARNFLPFAPQIHAQQPLSHLLITGGSQGALPINRAFVEAAELLAATKR